MFLLAKSALRSSHALIGLFFVITWAGEGYSQPQHHTTIQYDPFLQESEKLGFGVLILRRPTTARDVTERWAFPIERKIQDSLRNHAGLMHVHHVFFNHVTFSLPAGENNPYPRLASNACGALNQELTAKSYIFLYIGNRRIRDLLNARLSNIQFELRELCENTYELRLRKSGCVFDKESQEFALFQLFREVAEYNLSRASVNLLESSQSQAASLEVCLRRIALLEEELHEIRQDLDLFKGQFVSSKVSKSKKREGRKMKQREKPNKENN